MQRSKPVYYWDGIVDPRNLTKDYTEVIQKLINGEYRELNLEKLRGHNVYSIRINRANRILFTTVTIKNAPYVMILDVVLNHDYQKSSFLKPGVLKNYLEMNGHLFEAETISDTDFDKSDSLDESLNEVSENGADCDFLPAECFHQKFISFNDDQRFLAEKSKLPLVISGAAGSGKSCVALSMLTHYTAQHLETLARPILYVTESDKLCDSMRRNWRSLPIAQKDINQMVQFKTYRQLVLECDQTTANMKAVGRPEFYEFMTRKITNKKNQDKAARLSTFNDEFYNNLDVIYQELRIISGCDSWEQYKSLGARQSLVGEEDKRKWLFTEFGNYTAYLQHHQLLDLSFYKPKLTDQFQLIVVDESQDFSHLQLTSLCDAAFQSQICYCEDARQSLEDNLPKKTFFGRLLDAKNSNVIFKELSVTYRCPASVVKLANAISTLGATLSGQRQPIAMDISEQGDVDSTAWLTKLSSQELQALRHDAESPDFAVITLAEFKKEAVERL